MRRWIDSIERVDSTLKLLFASFARYFVLIITLVAVLAQFGLQTTIIIAVLGVAGGSPGHATEYSGQHHAVVAEAILGWLCYRSRR